MTKIYLIILGLLIGMTVQAKCSHEEIMRIDAEIGSVSLTVDDLYRVYKKIEKCKALDGGIAEGFYDKVSQLLIADWKSVLQSKHLKDLKFRSSLTKSISDATERTTFGRICAMARNAKNCVSNESFCRELSRSCTDTEEWVKAHIRH